MSKVTGMPSNNKSMFAVSTSRARRQDGENRAEDNTNKKNRSVVFAGDLNMVPDSILAKKQKAQREAMKMLKDVFAADLKTDAEQKARELHIEEMKKENAEAKSKLNDVEEMQQSLMEEYDVTQDSKEQQDLELLRKVKNAKDPFALDELTQEEKERYAQIKEQGFTKYQEKSLALDDVKEELKSVIADNQRDIADEADIIWNTDMARLKKHPMKDAAMDAARHLEAARKDMIFALYDEAKEHIDEKTEEAKEEQKEKAEEKKEEEKEEAVKKAKELEREILLQKAQENVQERMEEQTAKEKSRNQISLQNQIDEDILTKIHDGADKSVEIEQEIKDLLEKMKLLQEDIKGAAVDNTL